jgi:hypothetical protein
VVEHARVGRANLDEHNAAAIAGDLRAQPAPIRSVNVSRLRQLRMGCHLD